MKNFSSRIRELRASDSQALFATKLQMKQQTYARWEQGIRKPDIDELAQLAIHFGVSSDWLLGLTDERTPHGGKPSVTASGVGAVVTGGSIRNVRTSVVPQECQRCTEKDATIAAQAETIRMQAETISKLITNK